jgi:magnesium chelatase family protein
VGRINTEDLRDKGGGEPKKMNEVIRSVVERTRATQTKRYTNISGAGGGDAAGLKTNSGVSPREIQKVACFDKSAESFLGVLDKANLSPRGYYRLIKVARTIADLEEKDRITEEHLAEAFSYRLKEI